MFFTQQQVELLNSWPKNTVWAKEATKEAAQIFFSSIKAGKNRTEILNVGERKMITKIFLCSLFTGS